MSRSIHPIVDLLVLLVGNAHACRQICYKENLLNHGKLTPAAITTLVQIGLSKGCKQIELAERLKVEPMTLSAHIDRLEEQGLVERYATSRDRRSKNVLLTPDGFAALAETHAFLTALYSQASKDIAPAQMDRAIQTLVAIRKNLNTAERGN